MALALLDLDHTLLDGDSDYQWGEFLIEKKLVDKKTYAEANNHFYQEYENGTLDIVEYSAFCFKPFTQYSFDELDQLHKQYMQSKVIPMIKKNAQTTIDKHHAQGDTCVIISATNTFIVKPIAEYLGVKHALATRPKIENGRYTNKIEGTPCFKEGKVTNLQEWMVAHNQNLAGSYFYSDSFNDLPLLEIVDTPIIVDADDRLKAIAEERGWQIISLK